MSTSISLTSHQLVLRDKVIAALGSSLSLPEVLGRTRDVLRELTPSDYMGLCLITPGQAMEYQWMVPGERLALLEEYPRWVEHDFVRHAIFPRPNEVLRDSDMLSRKELEHSPLYQRSRELDLSLEHVMAALLPVTPGVLAAFTLYRDRRLPFSEQDAALVAGLLPFLVNAIRNCREMEEAATGFRLLEELHSQSGSAFLVVEPPGLEVKRSHRATLLLERWFSRSDFDASGIPRVLLERLQALTRMTPDERLRENPWVTLHGDGYRMVKFVELPEFEGPRRWALILHEIPLSIPLPPEMERQLTPKQVEIAKGLLRNWSNEQIAAELDRSEETVKTHVRDIFARLKCDSRADFLYQAAHLMKPV